MSDVAIDVRALLAELSAAEDLWSPNLDFVPALHRDSARNMVHYWAIRQHDLRPLQSRLIGMGLSSLGRCEPHVEHTLRLVLAAAEAMAGEVYAPPSHDSVDIGAAARLLEQRTASLFGPQQRERATRVMVTMPGRAARDADLVRDLVESGMDVARINCAHDDADAWRAMATHIREAAKDLGRSCSIAMDLGGPKLRTGPLDQADGKLRLGGGDRLVLTRDCAPAPADADPPRIGCTLPAVFDHAEPGHRVFFDDGKLAGTVESVDSEALTVRITHPAHDTAKLKCGKGINVPDTDLPVAALTDDDRRDLDTVVEIADIVQFSFVRRPQDVVDLLAALDERGADDIGLVLKIETAPAFERLPHILLAAMARRDIGVMIARGDLAVEVGYARMAELQEEMLWLCEAAHLPVVWATQVFEQLAKKGEPARAEVSDAALSGRAECVMLNKGRYITDAVRTLDDILRRMSEHTRKKTSLLRELRSWSPE